MAAGNRNRQTYIQGNTVRKLNEEPVRRRQEQKRQKSSYQVRKNREKATQMSAGYILLLIVSAVVMMALCVWYVNLKEENSRHSSSVTSLQQKLAAEKEANDALYDSVVDSVNLTELREKALEMGMKSVEDSQIVNYSSSAEDNVKQYEKIPKSGTLAESKKAKD